MLNRRRVIPTLSLGNIAYVLLTTLLLLHAVSYFHSQQR